MAYAKDEPEQATGFDSPLPIRGGVLLRLAAKKTEAEVGLRQKLPGGKYWQFGLKGKASDGETKLFSAGEGFAPDLSAKLGVGYSSFGEDPQRAEAVDRFMADAVAADLAYAVLAQFPRLVAAPVQPKARLSDLDALIQSELKAVGRWPVSEDKDKRDDVRKVLDAAQRLAARVGNPIDICDELSHVEWAQEACKRRNSEEKQRIVYPVLFRKMVSKSPAGWFTISANWQPIGVALKFAPVTNAIPDLATIESWQRVLEGGSIDLGVHRRAMIAGVQLFARESLDEDKVKPVEIRNTFTQGTYSYVSSEQAAIGRPEPITTSGAIVLVGWDPLLLVGATSALRPGLQVIGRAERGPGGARAYVLSVPIYLAPVDAPLDLVGGLRPSFRWARDGKWKEDLGVALFVTGRPIGN